VYNSILTQFMNMLTFNTGYLLFKLDMYGITLGLRRLLCRW